MLSRETKIKIIGRREWVDFPLYDTFKIDAKIDTGAYSCTLSCKKLEIIQMNNQMHLSFTLFNDKEFQTSKFEKKKIKNSFGEIEERFVIKTLIVLGRKKILTTVSLTNREEMRYPVLIGRKLLRGKFIVDVKQKYTNGIKLNDYITQ